MMMSISLPFSEADRGRDNVRENLVCSVSWPLMAGRADFSCLYLFQGMKGGMLLCSGMALRVGLSIMYDWQGRTAVGHNQNAGLISLFL